jgi:hypothetical protein
MRQIFVEDAPKIYGDKFAELCLLGVDVAKFAISTRHLQLATFNSNFNFQLPTSNF